MDIGSQIIDGRYAIMEKLGQGAFGAVFKAQDQVTGVTVAIKTIPDEVGRNADELEDLKQNFKLVTKLNHPHIANYKQLEYCKDTDKHLLVMEYVDGISLTQFRKTKPNRKVPVAEAVKICRQIADALDYAHQQSILHRDIKPENVRITASGYVKLLDFGLASEIRSTVLKLSRTIGASTNAGTRPYMAPEQFMGQPPNLGVDMYALGVLFNELVSGNLPFQSDDIQVLMNAVCIVPPNPLKELTKAQNVILLRMLAKEPAQRFPDAGAFVSALEGTLASPPSKTPKVLALLAVLALAGGGGWYVMKPPSVKPLTPVERVTADLFKQMLKKMAAIFRARIGLVPTFPGCSSLVYNQSKTALIRSANKQGWNILVRKDLQALINDQGMVNLYKTGKTDQERIKLHEVEKSQAVVVGNCVENELHLRVIGTNSVAFAAASGSLVDLDEKAQLAAEQQRKEAMAQQKQPRARKKWTDPTTDMKFVKIPGGCFQMGSDSGDSDEKPVHEVCVDDFWMGKYEVTNAQYRKFKSEHTSKEFKGHSLNGENQPVVYVSWDDAKAYTDWLSGKGNGTFRLPTEAEWEYAARAGTETKRYWGDGEEEACQYANVVNPSTKKEFDWSHDAFPCEDGYKVTAPVGKFRANKFGLYDTLGNVWEWTCSDRGKYDDGKKNHAKCSEVGSYRVFRGGGWNDGPASVRSAFRYVVGPGIRNGSLGFRLARTYR